MGTIIRHYQPSDQHAVFEISADTAAFGEPVEAFLEDRSLYIDAFARYYTDHETDYVWVAEGSGEVIGFLLGCVNTINQSRQWKRYIVSKVLLNALSGRYKLGRRTAAFSMGMLLGLIRGEEPSVDLLQYPAHLQIDVRKGYRGEGVGKRIIDAYLEQIWRQGVCGVHLTTTSANTAACHLYEKIGFELLDSRQIASGQGI
jgi:GNAT superfamily N-acetyltransferase